MEEKEEDDQKILIENAKKLLPELENKYNFSIILTEEKVLQKLIELKNNLESISKWILDEFGKKSEELYKEFKMETICDKNEGIEKIEELKYDKEKITEWIKIQENKLEKEKIETLYNELNAEFDFSNKIDKNEVINKIKEKNFDKESIKEWIKSKLDDDDIIGDKEKIEKMVALFDSEYNIENIWPEEDLKELRKTIVEFNYDEDKVRDWIELKLSS